MNSLLPNKKWTTKLSSAGLVYAHFGREVRDLRHSGPVRRRRLVLWIFVAVDFGCRGFWCWLLVLLRCMLQVAGSLSFVSGSTCDGNPAAQIIAQVTGADEAAVEVLFDQM